MEAADLSKIEQIVTLVAENQDLDPGPHWLPIEDQFGIEFPGDYKLIVDTFGAGCFCKSLCVFSPFSKRLNLVQMSLQRHDLYATFHQTFGKRIYPIFPDPGGLLAVAGGEDGNLLMYETIGGHSEWCLVWMNGHMQEIEKFSMSLAEYIVLWCRGEIRPEVDVGQLFPPLNRVPFFESVF
jgi:hypothetical protein